MKIIQFGVVPQAGIFIWARWMEFFQRRQNFMSCVKNKMPKIDEGIKYNFDTGFSCFKLYPLR